MMKYFLSIAALFCSSIVSAQVEPDTIANNIIATSLSNTSSSANLISLIRYSLLKDRTKFSINNKYSSNVTKLQENFVRDINELDVNASYMLFKNSFFGGGVTAKNLSDQKNVELNENSNSFFYGLFEYNPSNEFKFEIRNGYKNENQIGETNNGFRSEAYGEIINLLAKDYLINAKLEGYIDKLTEKNNHNASIQAEISNSFSEFAFNTGAVHFYNRSNDLYFPASVSVKNEFGVNNNIESRSENYLLINDKLNYTVNSNLFLELTGSFLTRTVSRDLKYKSITGSSFFDDSYNSRYSENSLLLGASLGYESFRYRGRVKLVYDERSETHIPKDLAGYTPAQVREFERIERNKNNASSRTTLLAEGSAYLSNMHTVAVTGSSSLLQYDTDSEENFDDRDELHFIGSASHTFDNLNNFAVTTTFDISLSKLAYLFSERSSNNYDNRIFKLTSWSRYKPIEKLYLSGLIQISANYTVYEFEDIVSQVQSFSFRQLLARDTISYFPFDKFSLNLYTEIKLSEQGEFNDSSFTVKPLTNFDDRNFFVTADYSLFKWLKVFAGYKMYVQKRFDFERGEKKQKYKIEQRGPAAGLNILIANNSYIQFTGGIDYFRYDDSAQNYSSSTITLNVLWNM